MSRVKQCIPCFCAILVFVTKQITPEMKSERVLLTWENFLAKTNMKGAFVTYLVGKNEENSWKIRDSLFAKAPYLFGKRFLSKRHKKKEDGKPKVSQRYLYWLHRLLCGKRFYSRVGHWKVQTFIKTYLWKWFWMLSQASGQINCVFQFFSTLNGGRGNYLGTFKFPRITSINPI